MDFGFSQEQEMLRQSARALLERECTSAHVRRMMEDERGYSPELWRKMAELGWLGLVLPETYGGAGLGYVDLVVVAEEMGRVLLPSPFIWTLAFAEAIGRAGSDEQKQRFLPAIARGEMVATVAHLEAGGTLEERGIVMGARRAGKGFILEGEKLFVNDAHVADCFLVAARTGSRRGGGVTLFAIDSRRAGITINRLKTMDQTRKLGEVRFQAVRVAAADVVGEIGAGWPILSAALDRAKVALAAEMMGGAQRVLEMAVEYSKVREQFGRPIGSFQAIQHKCANMMVDVEGAKSVVYYAAWAVSNGVADAPLAAAVAKAAASDAYRRTAAEGIQIHGGIGFTWEHDMHLYFKRAKSSEVTLGDANFNRELVAQGIGL
ncbi:MAG TPA: acyl-CoA dehydrogenase family protein [Candidatus Binataceae bacterium]|nr:acyl-CoA dehydrogenase family protein [Candidatus Binataceae bacterium]